MKIIVDLFNQHSGDFETLKRMATEAHLAGADAVKLQLYSSKLLYGNDTREYLELTQKQVQKFKRHCDSIGVEFMATVFDRNRLEWVRDLGVNTYKIASITAKNDRGLCEEIISTAKAWKSSDVIVSLGYEALNVFPFGRGDRSIKYLYCVPEYPAMLDDARVKQIALIDFKEDYYVGYSDHVAGLSAAIVAYTNGAEILEKHFTLDDNLYSSTEKGHLCSFTPKSLREFKNLTRELSYFR